MESQGLENVSRGSEFEEVVSKRLTELFGAVERHQRIEGQSGVKWKVDFFVGSQLIVEASIQRRLETKITSTFIRFADINRKHPEIHAALVVEKLHVLMHHTRGTKYFPTSEFKTFISLGYPILTLDDLPRLVLFQSGNTSAREVSSLPSGFYTRSIRSDTAKAGEVIVDLLKAGPMRLRDIVKVTGKAKGTVLDAIATTPQIKKVSTYYGLNEDEIYKAILKNGGGGTVQIPLVRKWLQGKFLEAIGNEGVCRTVEFAAEMGVHANSLTHLVHSLRQEGVIHATGKGKWSLKDAGRQTMLDGSQT